MNDLAAAITRALIIARRIAREQLTAVILARAELALSLAVLAGWALITLAIARLARPDVVWPLSAGVFLWLLCGVQWFAGLFWEGLYQLTRGGLDG